MLQFEGKHVWDYFQHESGKHSVQRIPPTEKRGRIQTSTVSVAILPVREAYYHGLADKDVEITAQRGHGKGGQHQNTTDSAIRMKHIPTGIVVFINGRDQYQNKKTAYSVLNERVNQYYKDIEDQKHNKIKHDQLGGGTRSGKIRTYNFIKTRVVDHILNKKTTQIDKVMKGRFDLLFGA